MKTFVITIIVGLIVFGSAIVMEMTRERDESEQIKNFVESHGNTPLPHSWRNEIGKGI